MPPEASSWPEIGLNRIETSTSLYGPSGDTMTLNVLRVACCMSTRDFHPGASDTSRIDQSPSTTVQPLTPLAAKSQLSILAPAGAASSFSSLVHPGLATMLP